LTAITIKIIKHRQKIPETNGGGAVKEGECRGGVGGMKKAKILNN
jgi:hypothetical protein